MTVHRRHFLALIVGGLATPALAEEAKTEAPMTRLTAYAFSFAQLDGGEIRLADFAGKPILVVNTAMTSAARSPGPRPTSRRPPIISTASPFRSPPRRW